MIGVNPRLAGRGIFGLRCLPAPQPYFFVIAKPSKNERLASYRDMSQIGKKGHKKSRSSRMKIRGTATE
jgi:hypothetical protein